MFIFKKITIDGTIKLIEILLLVFGTIFVLVQLQESDRLNWLQSIESRSSNFTQLEIDNNSLQCIYNYDDNLLDKGCQEILTDINEKRRIVIYLDELLDFFTEIIRYDKYCNDSIFIFSKSNEFVTDYKEWFDEIFNNNDNLNQYKDLIKNHKIKFINQHIRMNEN